MACRGSWRPNPADRPTDSLTPTLNGQLEVRFNQPIALDPTVTPATTL